MAQSFERPAALYERILEAVPGGVVYVAHDGSLLLANQSAQKFLGLKLDEQTERYVTDFATETFNEDGTICPVEDYPVSRCLATQLPQAPRTIGVRHTNGEIRWAIFTALPFKPGDGEPAGAVVSFVDITARKRAENQVRVLQAELAQRERLATVGTLAAAVAHEVNNPLSFMFLAIDNARTNLDRGVLDEAELMVELDDVLKGATRIRDIVRDLMSFARVDAETDTPSNLNDAIRTAVRIAAPELRYKAQVVCDLRAEAKIPGAGRLSQVVLNLVLNAGRAFRESTGNERVEVTSQELDGRIIIDVVDNGPGVDLNIMDRIFDPFFTTRDGGTGLGLAISNSLVKEMGGTLDLVAHGGAGACFRITLPRPPMPEFSTLDEEPSSARASRVLLIDDEPVIRRVGSAALSDHDVAVAESVAQAVQLLAEDQFHAVISDTMLLDGTGVDVYEWIAEHKPELTQRLAFITGGVFTQRVEEFLAQHDIPILKKPFGREALQELASLLLSTTLE